MTPASAPRCRIANASTGVGSGRGRTAARPAGPAPRRPRCRARRRRSCSRASNPIDDHRLGDPALGLQVGARPAAARMTTARFIRFGPAPSGAAKPGRAELEHARRSGPRGRPRRLVIGLVRGGEEAGELVSASTGSGSSSDPGLRPASRASPSSVTPSIRCDDVGEQPPAPARRRPGRPRAPPAWESGWSEMPAARLVTSEMPRTSSPPGGPRSPRARSTSRRGRRRGAWPSATSAGVS